ncbi:MAG: hypothetical protein VYD87_14355 [Pseudomonadota bacterium]|nr:hypothetical protein [Pseudomonadota bacterium]
MDTLTTIIDALPAWLNALALLITAAAAIATLTPSKSDDRLINAALKLVNLLALNVARAKNADAGGATKAPGTLDLSGAQLKGSKGERRYADDQRN